MACYVRYMNELITAADAAQRLGVPYANLAMMRSRGTGPAFYRKGNRVFYTAADLAKWQKARTALVRHER